MAVKLIPLAHLSKKPVRDGFDLVSDDPEVHAEWIAKGWNLGLILDGLVVADFDRGKNYAREFWRKHVKKNLWNVAAETYRGIHLIFTGETRPGKLVIDGEIVGDFKAGQYAYVVTPPSRVRQPDGTIWQYRWIPGYEWKEPLPLPEQLFGQRNDIVTTTRTDMQRLTRGQIRDLRAYLAKVESRQGKHGSSGLVRAAALCRQAQLTEAQATIEMLWWNTLPVVVPPWSHEEIARAVSNVYRKGRQ